MDLYVVKFGVVIGRVGVGIEVLKVELEKMIKKIIIVNIVEVRSIDKNV